MYRNTPTLGGILLILFSLFALFFTDNFMQELELKRFADEL